MKLLNLLPADKYVVVNKTILTETDKKNLINLYEPVIGYAATSLYLTLWSDLTKWEIISLDYTHHHLMTILKMDLNTIKVNRQILEAVGLVKTYVKTGELNEYVYELYSPLTAAEFLSHPILNIVLYNNIGKTEYELLKKQYQKVKIDLSNYTEITHHIKDTFKSTPDIPSFDVNQKTYAQIPTTGVIDFDLLIETIPKGLFNEKMLTRKVRELIDNLAYIYNLDTLKMCDLIRSVIDTKGIINKEELKKACRKYYQYQNGGLPTLIYRTQPEYLRTPGGSNSKRSKIISVFENTSPYDFLKSKYNGVKPTTSDLKLLETLLLDLELNPAVVNVLLDYTLKINDNKLTRAFIETIGGHWRRAKIQTAAEAMDCAEKEYQKRKKRTSSKSNYVPKSKEPTWFNQTIAKKELSGAEKEELDELLKEFK